MRRCLEIVIPVAVFVLAASALMPLPAQAGWPKPAGGTSKSGDPEVLFTFDDGPHETHTAAILDELQRRKIKAIFFWVGWRISRGNRVEERRAVIERAVKEGHLVANHTISHPNLCQLDAEAAAREIDDNSRLLEEASGLPIRLFRAPYGAHCQTLLRMLKDRALDHMHWDIDPQEWSHHSSEQAAEYVIRKLKHLEGRAIVIMHDTHRVTVKALPQILDWIEKENQRRLEEGDGRPIRIISGSALIAEQLDFALLTWLRESTAGLASELSAAALRLIP